ncbi:splicing factor C9orf78-like [Ptychodera flava]|uniref:splicing factor C9orf78-like n=1 Tax=Ptychodera flava TaxID=63121 RepID=UPI00396A4B5F
MASIRRKQFRRRRNSSDSSSDEAASTSDVRAILEETREAQKFRERARGVSAVGLAYGKKVSKVAELTTNDPFKLETGGLVDMSKVKDRNRDRSQEDQDRDVVDMGSTFAAETNRRDEDADMMKYIEEQMAKKQGKQLTKEEAKKGKTGQDLLYELPDRLKKAASSTRSEEMLSNQMLSGIPEVDLGIDAKIRNIEATEDAKQKLLVDRMKQKNETSFAPANMAVNYVQHSRYLREDTHVPKHRKEEPAPKPRPVVVGDAEKPRPMSPPKKRPRKEEKATDDFHYERFKKALRRY